MKIVIAPDSFKGSMTSIEIIETISPVINSIFKDVQICSFPIADGGEGTVDALTYDQDGEQYEVELFDPLFNPTKSFFGVRNNTAVIEMANCSGITMMHQKDLNPLYTSSYGTGQMIKSVLEKGYKHLVIGIGGSATNDGGTGALEALGVRFFDKNNNELIRMNGKKLAEIVRIDTTNLNPLVGAARIEVMCDVTNPLTGSIGATYVYGRQKGGCDDTLKALEDGMLNYKNVILNHYKLDVDSIPGSGAAGGMGAALNIFLKAPLVSGIHSVLKMIDFETHIKDADFIITGEGKVDNQSVQGKVINGITDCSKKYNIPVIAITGCIDEDVSEVYEMGVTCLFSLANKPMSLDDSMIHSKKLLEQLMYNICQLMKIGRFL